MLEKFLSLNFISILVLYTLFILLVNMIKIKILPLLLLLATACSQNKNELPAFDFSSTNYEKIELSDSSLVKNWKRVDFETTEESLIATYYQIIPCNNCIIAYTFNRILQFSSDGKFIQVIAREGNGPNEINFIEECIYDSANEKLYWAEYFKPDDITCYNLRTNSFDSPVPNWSGRGLSTIRKTTDDIFVCFSSILGEKMQPVFTQDLSGNLIEEKKVYPIPFTRSAAVGIPLNIFSLNEKWYYQGNFEDTLFNAITYTPVAIFSKGEPMDLEKIFSNTPGHSLRSLETLFTTNNQIFLRYIEYELRAESPNEGALSMYPNIIHHFILDNKFKKALLVESFFFSPLNRLYEGEELIDLSSRISSNNPKFLVYLQENEEDNPTLFIGELL